MKIGYDYFELESAYIFLFLKFAKEKKLKVLHIHCNEGLYTFYIPTYQRYLLHSSSFPLHYQKTIGLLKYILFLSHHYLNILGITCFFISVFLCSRLIFDIQIIGTMPSVNQSMKEELKKEKINYYYPLKNYETLNEILTHLKSTYKDDVEYLNVYQIGSVFHVEYTKRKQETLEKEDYSNLYAKKDGLIASFDVDSGLIKVKQNDYVKKGDLLVENTLVSTQNETKIIPVKGHVYAYTFQQYEASVQNVDQDQGEAFYQLLLMIRSKIPSDALIDKENVLQMTRTRSKIVLKMHYTLIEDIAVKGE